MGASALYPKCFPASVGRVGIQAASCTAWGWCARVKALVDDCSVNIKSLEAARIMKIKWLVLGDIEAKFCK